MVALHRVTEMLDSVPEYQFIQNGFAQSQPQVGRFLDAPTVPAGDCPLCVARESEDIQWAESDASV